MYPHEPNSAPSQGNPKGAGWWVGPAFLVVAAWFVWTDARPTLPSAPRGVAIESVTAPTRAAQLTDKPILRVGGYEHRCNGCHALFTSSAERTSGLFQHASIRFDHGMNDRCLNCHDATDREMLVLRDGSLVPFAESPRLCAQCHGPTYRDWETGAHGKTLGGWSATHPGRRRLVCVECHDPHSPAFAPIRPLPGPGTLRMGRQDYPEAHHERPLVFPRAPGEHGGEPPGHGEEPPGPDAERREQR